MKVKIGDSVYDSAVEPVMVILSATDKENISNMLPDATKYASFPDKWGSADEMMAWMKANNTQ